MRHEAEPLPSAVRGPIDELRRLEPPSDLLQAVMREVATTPRRRRWQPLRIRAITVAGSAALLVVVAVVVVPRLTALLAPAGASPTAVDQGSPPSASLSPGGTIELRIPVPEGAHPSGADSTSVWLGAESSGIVLRLDGTTGEELGRIQVNEPTDVPYDLWPVSDGESAWVGGRDDASLVRIDVGSMRIGQRWPINAVPYRILPAGAVVWVTSYDQGVVLKVSAVDGTVLGRLAVLGATGIAATPGVIYVVDYNGGLIEVDPVTTTVIKRYRIAPQATDLLAVGSDLFIWGINGRLLERFDTTTGTIAATTARVTGVALMDGAPWAAVSDGAVVRLDPASLAWTAVIPLGAITADQLVASSSRLWAYARAAEGTFAYAVKPTD